MMTHSTDFAHSAMSHRSSQCSSTGITKAVVCEMVHIKEPLLVIGKYSLHSGDSVAI